MECSKADKRYIVKDNIEYAVGATKIKVQHEHRHDHYSYSASFDMINDTAKKWIIVLSIFVLVQFGALAYCMHYVRNSELFLGQSCLEIYKSEYVTDKEKKEMLKDFYWIAFYPKKYRTVPKLYENESAETRRLLKTENSNLILRRESL